MGTTRTTAAETGSRPAVTPLLRDRTAIVSGAAGGLGRAISDLLSARGATVVLTDLDAEKLAGHGEALRGRGRNVITLSGDLADEEMPARLRELALAKTSRIDILVNNAGGGSAQVPVWEIDPADWQRDLDLNLSSIFRMCRAIVPTMIEAGYGRIVNVASMAGKEGTVRAGGYAAAKAGVIGLTKTLGKELARTGVLVNAITPSVIETDMLKADWYDDTTLDELLAKVPMGRIGMPAEVAELVGFLVSEQLSYSTGAVYDISGGRATY
ncbi:MAG: SDR family NAD(P)-dependent oxidoreductase [Solirubrobacterales bacterium]